MRGFAWKMGLCAGGAARNVGSSRGPCSAPAARLTKEGNQRGARIPSRETRFMWRLIAAAFLRFRS